MNLMWLALVLVVEARGPHHPRGEKVVKRHVHYQPTKNEKITQDVELLHDREHIQEHLEEVVDEPDFSKMTEEELEFYYFQLHDGDKNSKLDGLEILQALIHTSHHDHPEHKSDDEGHLDEFKKEFNETLIYYIGLIDRVLEEDDLDKDGYLSYAEYVEGRTRSKSPSVKMVP